MSPKIVELTGENLSVKDIVSIIRENKSVSLNNSSLEKCRASRKVLDDKIAEGHVIYGVNTSFGPMCNKIIHIEEIERLQVNLIRSHAAGLGDLLDEESARATLLIRLNTLVKGYSGVRVELLQFMRDLFNAGVAPVIPCQGSVGASGDLIHLAHLGLGFIGEGELILNGRKAPASEILAEAGLTPFRLSYKEGLAIMNGTAAMTAIAAIAIDGANQLLKASIATASFAMEIFGGIDDAFDPDLHAIKPHPGQVAIAEAVEKMIKGSQNITFRSDVHGAVKRDEKSGLVYETDATVQDVYSLRCTPQVLAPVHESIEYATAVVEREMNSSNDNPLIIPEKNKIIHGGNFHGQSISFAMDSLRIALSTLCNISERRLNKLLDRNLNEGLPENLIAEHAGLTMGFMGSQYLATSTTAENRQLAAPMSVNTISSNESNQDVVSMGTVSARLTQRSVENAKHVVTLEFLADLQALTFRNSEGMGEGTAALYKRASRDYSQYQNERIFHEDLKKFRDLLFNGDLLN